MVSLLNHIISHSAHLGYGDTIAGEEMQIQDIHEIEARVADLRAVSEPMTSAVSERDDIIDQLMQKARWFDAVVDNAPINIYLKSLDGRFAWVNRAFARMHDAAVEDVMGMSTAELFGGEIADPTSEHEAEVLRARRPAKSERDVGGRTLQILKSPVFDADNNVTSIVAFDTDISELKETQKQLSAQAAELEDIVKQRTRQVQKSEQRFRDFAETASDWFWEMDTELRFTYLSDPFIENRKQVASNGLGRTRREVYAEFIKAGTPEEQESWRRHFEDLEARRPIKNFVQRWVTPAGESRYYLNNGIPCYDENGDFAGYRGTGTDITERVLAEQALRESEARLAEAQEMGHIGHWRRDLTTGDAEWSDEVYRIFGWEPGTAPPSAFGLCALVHPDDLDVVAWTTENSLQACEECRSDHRIIRPNGQIRWVHQQAVPEVGENGQVLAMIGTIQDITQRKEAELALKNNEERFRDYAEASSDWLWEMDEQLRFTWISSNAENLRSLVTESVYGKTREEMGFPDEDEDLWRGHLAQLDRREPFRNFEYRLKNSGRIEWIRASGVPVLDDQGVFKGYRGTASNITVEVEARQAAVRAERRLVQLIEQMPIAVAMYDQGERLRYANERARELYPGWGELGDNPPTYEEMHWYGIKHGLTPPQAEGRETEWVAERLRLFREQGRSRDRRGKRWADTFWQKLDDGSTVQAIIDVTEQVEQEKQLRQAQRLEAMGMLVGGLAHEMNNLLQPIGGLSELALDQLDKPDITQQALQGIRDSNSKASEILQGMLSFARKEADTQDAGDLNNMLADTARMIRPLLSHRIELDVRAEADIGEAAISPAEFTQVVLNLVQNASDAMEGEGGVRVNLSHLEGENMARLSISDNGPGMPPEVAEKVFEPFFTTKGVGEGTGLGLSVVHNIVRDWGGSIGLTSPTDGGARFEISIPLV